MASNGITGSTAVTRTEITSSHSTFRSSHTESDPTKEEVEEKPWKYIGYNGYASLIASEKDFYILRRFTSLNIRVSLALQDEVVRLEKQLKELDYEYSRRSARDQHNGSFRCEREDRKTLIEEISHKLSQYNSLVLQQTELEKRPSPALPDIQSIRNWHYNHDNKAITNEEQEYLEHTHDLFSVVDSYKPRLRRLLERSSKFREFFLWHSKGVPSIPNYDKDMIIYTSSKRIDQFVNIIIITIGTLLLVAPIWILQALEDAKRKLAVITAFIAVFLGLFSSITDAKPFETLAATAAYSAVLMVFLQLGSAST